MATQDWIKLVIAFIVHSSPLVLSKCLSRNFLTKRKCLSHQPRYITKSLADSEEKAQIIAFPAKKAFLLRGNIEELSQLQSKIGVEGDDHIQGGHSS